MKAGNYRKAAIYRIYNKTGYYSSTEGTLHHTNITPYLEKPEINIWKCVYTLLYIRSPPTLLKPGPLQNNNEGDIQIMKRYNINIIRLNDWTRRFDSFGILEYPIV